MITKKEFEMQKELIELKRKAEIEVEQLKHKDRIEEIILDKEVKLEIQRVRSAEIKRTIDRKGNKDFIENYWK